MAAAAAASAKPLTQQLRATAVYTAGVVLPHPISSCRYYHRSLNPKKLIEVKFSHKHPKLTYKVRGLAALLSLSNGATNDGASRPYQGTLKHYALPDKTQTPGLRPLERRDVAGACAMLNKFLLAYHLTVEFTVEEFEHWFLPREVGPRRSPSPLLLAPTLLLAAGRHLLLGGGEPQDQAVDGLDQVGIVLLHCCGADPAVDVRRPAFTICPARSSTATSTRRCAPPTPSTT